MPHPLSSYPNVKIKSGVRLVESKFFQHGRNVIYRGTANLAKIKPATPQQAAAVYQLVGAGPLTNCKSWWASQKLQVTVGRCQLQFGASSAAVQYCKMDSKELESPEQDSKRFINRKYSCLVGIVSVVLTGAAIAAVITVFIETSPGSWSESYVWAGTKQVAESEEIGSYVARTTRPMMFQVSKFPSSKFGED